MRRLLILALLALLLAAGCAEPRLVVSRDGDSTAESFAYTRALWDRIGSVGQPPAPGGDRVGVALDHERAPDSFTGRDEAFLASFEVELAWFDEETELTDEHAVRAARLLCSAATGGGLIRQKWDAIAGAFRILDDSAALLTAALQVYCPLTAYPVFQALTAEPVAAVATEEQRIDLARFLFVRLGGGPAREFRAVARRGLPKRAALICEHPYEQGLPSAEDYRNWIPELSAQWLDGFVLMVVTAFCEERGDAVIKSFGLIGDA